MTLTGEKAAIGPTNAPPPPLAPGAPWLGNALQLARDPVQFLLNSHHKYGPIFRVRVMGEEVTTIAGLDANQFAQRRGDEVFTNQIMFGDLALELGSPLNMAALEGEQHKYFRKLAARGYSRDALLTSMPAVARVVDKFVKGLAPGDSFDVFSTLQRLVSLQLGAAAAYADAEPRIDDLQRFMRFLLNVLLTGAWPRFMFRAPAYRRAKARSHEFVRDVVEFHRAHPPGPERHADLIDGFLAAHDANPETMPIEAVRSAAFGPFLAGQDTVAATTAFMLYETLANPEVHERVQADVENLFRDGPPDGGLFTEAKALRAAAVETMRLHPVAPMMPQHVVREFEFAGRRVPAGKRVFVAQTLTHFLPEHFDRPFEFRLDRPRPEPLTYAPFGLGPHTCIGAAMGELQVMINVALLLRLGEFAIEPKGYRLRTRTIPPAPKGFRLRFERLRDFPEGMEGNAAAFAKLWRPGS